MGSVTKAKHDVNVSLNTRSLLETIFRGAFFVCVAVFLWKYGPDIINGVINRPEPQQRITEAQITHIVENIVLHQNVANQKRFEDLLKEMSRQQAKYTDSQVKTALELAKEYGKQRDAQITELANIVSKLGTSFKETVASLTYKDEEKPSRSFEHYDLERTMSDGSKLKTGWFKYHPEWEGEDKAVQYFYPLETHLNIIKSEKEDGTYANHVEAWIENPFVIDQKGIKFPLDLSEVQFETRPIKEKRWRWNPRFGLGAGVTNEALFPSLDFSFASYGRTKVDMDWRFMTLGIGGAGFGSNETTEVIGSFTPVQFNLGNYVPLIENMFIGPTVSVDTSSNTGYGVMVSIPF